MQHIPYFNSSEFYVSTEWTYIHAYTLYAIKYNYKSQSFTLESPVINLHTINSTRQLKNWLRLRVATDSMIRIAVIVNENDYKRKKSNSTETKIETKIK